MARKAFGSSDRRIANNLKPFLVQCNLTLVYYGILGTQRKGERQRERVKTFIDHERNTRKIERKSSAVYRFVENSSYSLARDGQTHYE